MLIKLSSSHLYLILRNYQKKKKKLSTLFEGTTLFYKLYSVYKLKVSVKNYLYR